MSKIYDVVARVGSYTDQTGQEKGRFQNVGAVIQNSNGGMNLLLAKWFNPAALAEDGKESVILSLFEPQQKAQQVGAQAGLQQPQQQPQQGYVNPNGQPMNPQQVRAQQANQGYDDDIPFR